LHYSTVHNFGFRTSLIVGWTSVSLQLIGDITNENCLFTSEGKVVNSYVDLLVYTPYNTKILTNAWENFCTEDGSNRFLRNAGQYLRYYTVYKARRQTLKLTAVKTSNFKGLNTVLTRALHYSLPWASWGQSTLFTPYLPKLHFNIIFPYVPRSVKWFFLSDLPTKILNAFLI